MKYLVIPTESFSVKGLKKSGNITFSDLPFVVRKFVEANDKPFIILDESSKIKTNAPIKEKSKSTRTQLIKKLSGTGHRCIMSGTMMSKSPVNLYDQFDFLSPCYFGETMWSFAERYCIMITLRNVKGRRVLISQKIYFEIRDRLSAALKKGRDWFNYYLRTFNKTYSLGYDKLQWIIEHKNYSPFINMDELLERIAPVTMRVTRDDVFDVKNDYFVKHPIERPIALCDTAKQTANSLIKLGFTDKFVLGKAAALELALRLQDVCNGFEPVSTEANGVRTITLKPFKENPKIDALLELLDEIGIEKNQVVVWSSRTSLLNACAERLRRENISFVVYDGSVTQKEKQEAIRKFVSKEVRVFLANQATGSYGLDFLSQANYCIYFCIDGSVERYYQSQHRLLRGEVKTRKFSYHIYVKDSIEERQLKALTAGQELITGDTARDIFEFSKAA